MSGSILVIAAVVVLLFAKGLVEHKSFASTSTRCLLHHCNNTLPSTMVIWPT